MLLISCFNNYSYHIVIINCKVKKTASHLKKYIGIHWQPIYFNKVNAVQSFKYKKKIHIE